MATLKQRAEDLVGSMVCEILEVGGFPHFIDSGNLDEHLFPWSVNEPTFFIIATVCWNFEE